MTLFKVNGLYSFVPTSWYIWTLFYFYIFYFLVFRYVKSNIFIKVVLTCALVSGYIIIAPLIRNTRCPAFCIGMLFGLFDNTIRTKFVRWHALIALALLVLFFIQPLGHRLDVCIYPIAFFIFMYIVRDLKEIRIVKFLSSISLEMFIIQYIPIYIATNDLHLTSTYIVISLVLILDIILAYIIHFCIQRAKHFMERWKVG